MAAPQQEGNAVEPSKKSFPKKNLLGPCLIGAFKQMYLLSIYTLYW